MKKPSPALTTLIFFWVGYTLAVAVVLYRALPPLQLELLLILGAIAAVLVVVSLVLVRRAPASASEEQA